MRDGRGTRAFWSSVGALLGASTTVEAATNVVAKATNSPAVPTFHDIKPPIEIATLWTWLARIGAVVVLGALLWLSWWLWQRRKPKGDVVQLIPADERARARLTAALALLDHPERFCTAVSEITRTYLEERFGLRAPDQTTEEFLADLPRSAVLDVRHKGLLADFLTRTDLVKFAKFEPTRVELEDLHAAALNLVEETAPVAAPANTAPPTLATPPVAPRPLPPPPPMPAARP